MPCVIWQKVLLLLLFMLLLLFVNDSLRMNPSLLIRLVIITVILGHNPTTGRLERSCITPGDGMGYRQVTQLHEAGTSRAA